MADWTFDLLAAVFAAAVAAVQHQILIAGESVLRHPTAPDLGGGNKTIRAGADWAGG